MRDSPCHYCTKRPCFIHDTCPEYQEFRAELDKITAKRASVAMITDSVIRSFERVNRKKWRSNRK
jgi:hypothetical protein